MAEQRTREMEPTTATGIRDNHQRGSVADFLKSHIKDGSHLSVVSAFFTIYAYDALKQHLDHIGQFDFLFGDPRSVRSLDPDKTEKKAFYISDDGLELQNSLQQKRVARECAEWIRQKVAIRSVRQRDFLHGKMYHISSDEVKHAIVGSSNFTVRGLGLSDNSNIELNLIVDSDRDREDLKTWFDDLWNDESRVQDVKDDVLRYLEQLYQNHAPEFIYYKTLFHIFEGFLADTEKGGLLDEKIRIVDTDTWKALYSFQRDGVKGAINRIIKHNGCIIADSVGLGKTFEALAIIKYFELKNERVLVLCPKRLRENWTVYRNNDTLNPFIRDRFRFDVLSHTDLSREGGKSGDIDLATFNWGNFDLVVIDESHNFRNNTKGRRDEDGNVIRKSRYERLMDDIIRSGVRTKVLLLSATPVNNDLRDLRNQLYFLTENRDDAFAESLGIGSLKETLATAQRQFSVWAKQQSHERKTSELLERLSSALFKLLDELTIARSRKHIHRYYKESIAGLGGFPERLKPISRYSPIDLSSRFLSYDKLNDEISGYKLSLFNPTFYLKPEFKSQYPADTRVPFTQADRESYLIAMMKVNFLKRLESSVKSFEITMERTIGKIETLEQKIRQFQRLRKSNDDIDLNELGFDTDDEEVQDVLEVGSRIKYKLEHLRLEEWLKDLRKDRDQLRGPHLAAKDMTIERDAKFQELKELIAAKISNPTINKRGEPNRKVLVFTAFADTASYLYDNLKDWAFKERGVNIALVSGGSVENRTTLGRNNFNHIIVNFSPRSKSRAQIEDMPQQGEIDILIATDCISEGQNLQDCDYLVNYDIHWNPVRIIQRFGRIDRIGSVNKTVQLVNFWPTEDLNKYINLKNRVEARMALVDIAATFEDNILSNEDIRDLVSEDLKYRDKQLLRLQKEILDLEDFSESISLNEFTLDDFRMELIAYIEANRKALQEAPFGLYAVVPPVSNHPIITPGVIFCFKQKAAAVKAATEASRSRDVNPLQPYFLVYVREDKEVRYTFAHPKQILDILRQLCRDRTAACDELCELFDAQTSNGSDMRFYTELLSAAVDSITRTFQKRVAAGLQQGRDFVIPDKQEQARDAADFELVTWLVIKQA